VARRHSPAGLIILARGHSHYLLAAKPSDTQLFEKGSNMATNNKTEFCPVWFITGASSGVGQALTVGALDRGDRVVATARRPEALTDLEAYSREA
jgi:hypothetical protein